MLPEHTDADDPYSLFNLFFNNTELSSIRDNTNKYADSYKNPTDKPFSREWFPTTIGELKAYIAIYIYINIYKETSIEDF